MAGFHTHITVSTAVGIGYAAWGGAQYGLPLSTCVLAGGLCSIAGMLPDLDSDGGVPARETMGLAAAVVPMLLFQRLHAQGLSVEHLALAGAPIYLLIRFGLGSILKAMSVHRGMFHSIPAAIIAGLIGYLICDSGVTLVRYYKAFAVTLGYMSHLLLDELWSIDVTNGLPRTKKSFGTALKLFGDDPGATLTTYCILGLLTAFIANDVAATEQKQPLALRTNPRPTPPTVLVPKSQSQAANPKLEPLLTESPRLDPTGGSRALSDEVTRTNRVRPPEQTEPKVRTIQKLYGSRQYERTESRNDVEFESPYGPVRTTNRRYENPYGSQNPRSSTGQTAPDGKYQDQFRDSRGYIPYETRDGNSDRGTGRGSYQPLPSRSYDTDDENSRRVLEPNGRFPRVSDELKRKSSSLPERTNTVDDSRFAVESPRWLEPAPIPTSNRRSGVGTTSAVQTKEKSTKTDSWADFPVKVSVPHEHAINGRDSKSMSSPGKSIPTEIGNHERGVPWDSTPQTDHPKSTNTGSRRNKTAQRTWLDEEPER